MRAADAWRRGIRRSPVATRLLLLLMDRMEATENRYFAHEHFKVKGDTQLGTCWRSSTTTSSERWCLVRYSVLVVEPLKHTHAHTYRREGMELHGKVETAGETAIFQPAGNTRSLWLWKEGRVAVRKAAPNAGKDILVVSVAVEAVCEAGIPDEEKHMIRECWNRRTNTPTPARHSLAMAEALLSGALLLLYTLSLYYVPNLNVQCDLIMKFLSEMAQTGFRIFS